MGFASPIDYPIPAQETFGFGNAELADFDADGHLDLVAAGTEVNCSDPSHCSFTPKVVLMLGNGTGALTAGALRTTGNSDLAVGDVDEDGHLDVITTAATTTLSFLAGTGTADLAPAVAVTAPRATCEVEAGDIDADGHLDLVVAFTDHDGWVLFGDGTGQVPAAHGLTTTGGSACNHTLSRNLDADPKPDVIYMNDDSPGSNHLVASINALNARPSH